MRAKSILARRRLDLEQRPDRSYSAIGEDIQYPREEKIRTGHRRIRVARDRSAQPDGSRHIQKEVLRHKVWLYKPEHYVPVEAKIVEQKRQTHRADFMEAYGALQ